VIISVEQKKASPRRHRRPKNGGTRGKRSRRKRSGCYHGIYQTKKIEELDRRNIQVTHEKKSDTGRTKSRYGKRGKARLIILIKWGVKEGSQRTLAKKHRKRRGGGTSAASRLMPAIAKEQVSYQREEVFQWERE